MPVIGQVPRVGQLAPRDSDIEHLAELFKRIQDSLNLISGVTGGDFRRGRWTHRANSLRYHDANDQLLHGFGDLV